MKKLNYVLCSMIILLGCLLNFTPIAANSITVRVDLIEPNVKASFYQDGMLNAYSILGYIHANGEIAYCVEPYKRIDSGEIMVEASVLSENQKEQISIISYNGYNQSNRKSDKWYMATQLMIWEYLGVQPVLEGFDDYSQYRQQIQENINNFKKQPSFNGDQITLKKGEKVTISDHNNVFPYFTQMDHTGNALIEKIGNDLSVLHNSNKYEEGTISFKKFSHTDLGLPIVYRSATDANVQAIIYPKLQNNVEGSLTYRIQPYGNLKFMKTGDILLSSTIVETDDGEMYQLNYGEGKLNNVKANVYARENIYDVWGKLIYEKDALIDTLISGDKESSKELIAGKYYLKEVETIGGYVLDKKEYDFTISKEKEEIDIVSIVLSNQRAKVNLVFQKIFEDGSLLDLSEAYQDVVIGIYTKHDIKTLDGKIVANADSLIYRSHIDEKGNLIEPLDLPLGDYYLKELHTNEHFILDENVYHFSVKDNKTATIDVIINDGTIMNMLHRNQLKIYKVDQDNTPLQAKFVLYDQEMNEILEFETNKDGTYEFKDLVDGIYYLQEIEAPEGYKLNGKIHKIILNEDLTYTVKNTKNVVNPSIETNDTGNHRTFEFSMLGSMIAMYGLVFRKLSKF